MSFKSLCNRIKSDFFLPDRIREYESILQYAIENDYEILSHSEYFSLVENNQLSGKKILIIRQDIDSDPKYVYKWLALQKKYGVHSSMYFRLCTYDKQAMLAVQASGSDCGYHYEEIADYAKGKKLLSKEAVIGRFSDIIEKFKLNLRKIESDLEFKILYIASHGDFANRKLGLPNHTFVTPELLAECGLKFEAYQSQFVDTYSINISDCGYPKFYKGRMTPKEAIQSQVPVIHFLMHPKHWRSSWYWNIYENFKRLKEGFFYR
ncbi:MAG: hypothetical protein J0G96_13310 [Flavobacteriia bacterium]|nr:hypothetical protein [Flavobacteriia bacterium]OJX37359.1 MAG: hypothetical protein BGO87_01595 [Flavobacteriia bacterium 40-80]